ncbi:MipA/OmpV family protein [Permianibacter sp. IMCC34836]|uniref:MipA/OmpV family protein n=1 Tax=Permianibacter fluminis TaxID=2738515 RepID=UPI0015521214|nr:MipA/OmpV family protein [Permianibacter fluminis]NQD35538.1 MipA/OmpV family protein [Permianibacter fluminis]
MRGGKKGWRQSGGCRVLIVVHGFLFSGWLSTVAAGEAELAPASGFGPDSTAAAESTSVTGEIAGDTARHTESTQAEWELGIGGTAVHIPHYIGADDARDYVLPFPYFVYRSERLNVDRNFIHGKLLERDDLKIELSLSGTPPVDSDDNDARAGMPDLDATGELGPSIQYTFREADDQIWRADLAIRKVIGTDFSRISNAGYTVSPQLYFSQRWQTDANTRWQFESTLGPSYGDNRYHDFFYAVAPAYATSDRAAYDAAGGFGGWRWALGLTRREGNFWFGAFVRYYDLSDAVFLDSPLVRREHSVLAGFAVAWILKANRNPLP